jgi:hypothetical protein
VNFLRYDWGHRREGDTVIVTLTAAANVRLLDATNFRNYSEGRAYRYYGGLFRQSPVRIPVPHAGHWHTVVDMQGLSGTSRVTAQILSQQ